MATYLSRFATGKAEQWGVVTSGGISALEGDYATTAELLEHGRDDWTAAASRRPTHLADNVQMLSPITIPCRVLCQGANFRQHAIDSGMDPDNRAFNLFFDKTDASITGPHSAVTRPSHVRLLDHEIELALVIGKAITEPTTITPDTLREYVVALTIADDLSARDVQLPQGQYLKGKSYRGFCPMGPVLAILDDADYDRIDDLVLRLHVNGDLRQSDTTANFVYRPAESLTELSTFSNLDVGDVLLTGTPHGTAATSPPAIVRRLATALLPEHVMWKLFIRRNLAGPFLKPGDTVTATIRSSDGALDLGEQRTPIIAPN